MPAKFDFKTFCGLGEQTRYCCPFCPFDHYAPPEVLKHVVESHREDAGAGGPVLFDYDDKPIPKVIYGTTNI